MSVVPGLVDQEIVVKGIPPGHPAGHLLYHLIVIHIRPTVAEVVLGLEEVLEEEVEEVEGRMVEAEAGVPVLIRVDQNWEVPAVLEVFCPETLAPTELQQVLEMEEILVFLHYYYQQLFHRLR
jgi:hypothetical protein